MRADGRHSARRSGFARAAIAVAALYALVLQAFLGGLMPMPAHAEGLICAAADPATPHKAAAHDRAGCCTPAQVAFTALPARPDAAVVTWPARAEARIAWTFSASQRARAAPGSAARARGPPVA